VEVNNMKVVITAKIVLDTGHNDPAQAIDEAERAITRLLTVDGIKFLITTISPAAMGFGKIQ
jgi:ribosomal protein L5